jgi:electron transport complex protein RnfC
MVPLPQAQAPWTRAMADAARARFQLRSLRLAREQDERAERLARKAEEKLGHTKKAVIRAALERAKARKAGIAPRNTDHLPPQIRAGIDVIDARRRAAKKS